MPPMCMPSFTNSDHAGQGKACKFCMSKILGCHIRYRKFEKHPFFTYLLFLCKNKLDVIIGLVKVVIATNYERYYITCLIDIIKIEAH